MGKTQKKRAMRRHNPVRVPDSHLPQGLTSAAESSSKTQAILPIMQKMQGTDAGERKWACVAVSNIIQNDPSTRRLLQGKNIVGALITRLTDSEEEVVIEAMGSLRNLAIDGGYDICAEMYNKSILVPLKTFVPKIAATLAQFLEQGVKHAPENAQRLMYEFADNVITVLWCLSETSNKALNAINEMKLASFLMSFLAVRDKMPLATITAAAQCLYVITDDNYAAISDVRSDGGYISCLMSIVTSEGLRSDPGQTADPRIIMLRVLASGILGNVSPITPPSAASALDIDRDVILPQLLPVISSLSLSEVSRSALQLIEEQSTVPSIDKLSLKKSPKTDHKSASEVELDRLEGQLRTVQLALEILTGVSAALPDPESVEGVDDELENEVVIEDEETVDEDIAMDVVPDEVERATQSLPQIVEPLLALIQPTTLSFPPHASPSPHPPTTSAMSAVHIAALECLNNIFLSLARHDTVIEIDAGRTVWNAVWSSLAAVGTQIVLGQERRQAMWEVAAGVLWGVASVCKGKLEPDEGQVQALMALCDSAGSDAQLRVKCIGTLECLARNTAFMEINATIGGYLLSMLPSMTEPSPAGTEPMLQAASSIIDIYSDEGAPYDANFRAGGYLVRLTESVDGLKKAVRGIDRKKELQLRRRGEEVRDNLVAFIQYRKKLKL